MSLGFRTSQSRLTTLYYALVINFATFQYAGVKVGPVVKRDVMKASVMLEHEVKYAVILAFDVKIERDAQDMADSLGVKVFQVNSHCHRGLHRQKTCHLVCDRWNYKRTKIDLIGHRLVHPDTEASIDRKSN